MRFRFGRNELRESTLFYLLQGLLGLVHVARNTLLIAITVDLPDASSGGLFEIAVAGADNFHLDGGNDVVGGTGVDGGRNSDAALKVLRGSSIDVFVNDGGKSDVVAGTVVGAKGVPRVDEVE